MVGEINSVNILDQQFYNQFWLDELIINKKVFADIQ